MKSDGGLRSLFRQHLTGWQWSSVESGITSPGIPDSEFCTPFPVTGWIEFKKTNAWAVTLRPLQVAWIARRARLGGRVWVGARRLNRGNDELWLVPGKAVMVLAEGGLKAVDPKLGQFETFVFGGGPGVWNWGQVGQVLERGWVG